MGNVVLPCASLVSQWCCVGRLQAGLSVLEERDKLGSPGVTTPGALLRNTTCAERLKASRIKIEVLSDVTK